MLYSLIDPFDGCQYLSDSLDMMIEWAEKSGATRFQIIDNGKFVCHVQKCNNGEWRSGEMLEGGV